MEALYLYCIREKTETAEAFSTKGIDKKGEVIALEYRDLEAIISWVSLEEFSSEEIQKKAQEDLGWIKEKASVHEKVIEEAMRKNHKILSLIPMRFGTIFKEKTTLEESLGRDYLKIKGVLGKIRGQQEWSIKVYLKDREKLERVIKEKGEAIKEKEKEIASLPEGMAFFIEEELRELISQEVGKELSRTVQSVFERLAEQAVASVKNKTLEKELTGRCEPMALNSAFLIPEEKTEDFQEAAEALDQEIETKGFWLECSGPWPCFNFTSY